MPKIHLSPLRAIRARCLDCSDTRTEVIDCVCSSPIETPPDENGGNYCALYPYRMGHKPKGAGSVLKAIRKYCLWCCNGSSAEVAACPRQECSLHEFRRGHNPALAGKGGTTSNLLAHRFQSAQ